MPGDRSREAGTVLVAMLIALVVVGAIVTLMVASGRRSQEQGQLALQGVRARYAADAAAEMGVKELMDGVDHDGDGAVGSISDDGNTANDPTINNGTRLWAERSDAGGVTTITARGQNADAARAVTLTATVGSGSTSTPQLYFTRESSAAVRRSAFNTSTSTWGAASVSASLSLSPTWAAAAMLGTSTAVLVSDSDLDLRYGPMNASGTGTFTSICSDLGSSNTRPFDVAVEPTSGEGLVIYFDKSSTSMRFRTIVNGTISGASSMGMSTKDVYWAQLIPMSASGNEIMALMIDGDKDLFAARWTGSAWTDRTTLHTNLDDEKSEGADGALEMTSGRLMVAFGDGGDNRVGFRIYTPGSGWSSTQYSNGYDSKVRWMRLASAPASNTIFLAAQNSVNRVRAARWNGSSWSSSAQITDNTGSGNNRRFDIAVSPDGSDIMLMYAKASSQIFYRLWNGSAWTSEATAFTLASGTNEGVLMRPGPSGGMLVGAVGDHNGGVTAWSWSGSAFNATNRVGTTSTSFRDYEWYAIPSGGSGSGSSSTTVTGFSAVAP